MLTTYDATLGISPFYINGLFLGCKYFRLVGRLVSDATTLLCYYTMRVAIAICDCVLLKCIYEH